MPQQLVDLDALDLSKTLYGKDDFHRVLRQRGTFSLLDGVLHLGDDGEVVAYKDIRADEWWAADHIPGRPIFPGVLMVEASAQLGTFDFFIRRPDFESKFVGFTGIDKIRFRATVEPDCRLLFVAKVKRVRNMMFTYACQGVVDGNIVFDGELTGMALCADALDGPDRRRARSPERSSRSVKGPVSPVWKRGEALDTDCAE